MVRWILEDFTASVLYTNAIHSQNFQDHILSYVYEKPFRSFLTMMLKGNHITKQKIFFVEIENFNYLFFKLCIGIKQLFESAEHFP